MRLPSRCPLLAALVAAFVGTLVAHPVAARETPSELAALVAEAAAESRRLRGLGDDKSIRVEALDKGAVERYVAERISEADARAGYVLTAAYLEALGALPPGTDLEAVVLGFARDQVAGYWDFQRQVLVVADWIPAAMQRPTLVHEATHAYQDRAFGLARFMTPRPGVTEPFAAAQALFEGDATLVMFESMAGAPLGGAEVLETVRGMKDKVRMLFRFMPGMADVPDVLRESLLFPYLDGLGFVMTARAAGGWKAVDALYRSPPLSTEQVLHPEKLSAARADPPIEVSFPADPLAAGPGWRVLGTDIAGELTVRLVLQEWLPQDQAERAAAGWGGDRYSVLRGPGGRTIVLWFSTWDSEPDAREAEAAIRQAKRPPQSIGRRGRVVGGLWSDGPLPAALLDTAWKGLKTREIKSFDDWVGPRKGR